jgi:rRNA maturation protein Nop10
MSQAYPDLPVFLAPLSLNCSSCGSRTQLFDPRCDGHDGEIKSSAGAVGQGDPSAYCCPNCANRAFDVATLLEYSIDDEEMEDWPELAARPQNYFTWFTLFGWCQSCGKRTSITDYECA